MSDKNFYRILTAVIAAGVLSVIALIIYTFILYSDCSIISYIQNRG